MDNEKRVILVVDDDSDNREMLVDYLRFRGFTAIGMENGTEAVRYARETPPAIILMDLQMPGLSGWNATKQLRRHIETEGIIVIAISAHAMSTDGARALTAGCDGYVAKPYDIVKLGDAIARLMTEGRQGLSAITALGT